MTGVVGSQINILLVSNQYFSFRPQIEKTTTRGCGCHRNGLNTGHCETTKTEAVLMNTHPHAEEGSLQVPHGYDLDSDTWCKQKKIIPQLHRVGMGGFCKREHTIVA